jgi:multisubunit Na+/H+ antiporter MnhB subunit
MKMTKIVRTTADLFFPFCLVFGLYVVVHGHLTPGGGFQGGAVMATARRCCSSPAPTTTSPAASARAP